MTSPDTAPTIPATMRAIAQDRYGPPDVLELRQVPTPKPEPHQVLIRVAAASLNIYDWHMTTGTPFMVRAVAGRTKPDAPIPGADVAGTVVAVGSDVTEFSVGDEVFGDIGAGAFAEYAAAKPANLTRKPADVSFAEAAATPLAAITALQGLRDVGGVQAGQRVIVNGASGGVGTFAVQIAKALGADVTAVCSTGKVDQAAALGSDRVIDYTTDDYTATERGYDLLFDNVGNRPWSETSQVLADGGTVVTITGPKKAILGPFRALLWRKARSTIGNKRFVWFTASVKTADLETLAEMLADGRLVPAIEATYPLDDLPAAMARLGEGHAAGKLVIEVAS